MMDWDSHTYGRVGWTTLLVVIVAVYARAVGFEAIPSWDDALFVLDRETVTNWWGVSWYRRLATPEIGYASPIPTFIYAHSRLFVGESAYPHVLHGLNIVLHVSNVALVGWLVSRWSRPQLGLVVAAMWGLHPVCVESVAWLTNLKTLLATVGVLGALGSWERAAETSSWVWRVAAGGGYVVALGCRPDAVVFVPIAAFRSLWRVGWREAIRSVGPWLAMVAGVGVAWVLWAKSGHDAVIEYSAVAPGTQSVPIRMARALELTVRHLFMPIDLNPGYFRDPSAGGVAAIPGAVIAVGLTVLLVGSFVTRWYQITFGIAFFAAWFAPFSGIVFLPRFIADTYLYGPSIGLLFATVAGVDRWLAWRRPWSERTTTAVVVAVSMVLAGLTALQVGRWKNAKTLWKPVIRQQPRVTRPYEQVAIYYVQNEQWKKAYETIKAGLPVFRQARNYPSFAAAVFDDAGHPREAAQLAVEAVLKDADPEPLHYKALLDVFARREIPPPKERKGRQALLDAVEKYQQREEWMSHRVDRLHIADYLTKYFDPALAVPFIRRELTTPRPDCFVSILVRRLDDSSRISLAGSIPDKCKK